MAKVVELYRACEEFEEEVSESFEWAYNYGFYQCLNLVKKLYLKVDISKVTPKMAIEMSIKGDFESPPEATKESAKKFGRSLTRVNTTEAIIVEPIYVVPPVEIEVLEASKKSESSPTAEPTTTDTTRKPKQTKKKPTKEAPMHR